MLFLDPFGLSDAGKVRRNNEDAYLAGEGRDETLLAIADGIGGFEAGEGERHLALVGRKELD